MTKPDDIPQDVWDAAVAADEAANAAYGDSINDPFVPIENIDAASITVIARAIMAEREACAQVVQDTPEAIEHPAGPLYASGWAHAVIAIREAIRNRGAAA